MTHTEQRKRLRTILAGSGCVSPASVFDPLSARVAESVGYETGILAGSVVSNTTLAAPDLIVVTLTEFADQVRRIMRVSRLSLLVDADHGYGNALNVMRTVEELEHAGVSALTIEDTALPRRFGQPADKEEQISTEEMAGKLRAAVAARVDPALVIAGRTSGLRIEGTGRTVERVKAYSQTGVDAIFLVGMQNLAQLEAVRAATPLPIMLGSFPASLKREELAARGVRIALLGHQPVAAAVRALRETYVHLFKGGAPADIKSNVASNEEMEEITRTPQFTSWQKDYLE
jgi:carboxyvinyl-carboxyphosphonate phosphorylmutase